MREIMARFPEEAKPVLTAIASANEETRKRYKRQNALSTRLLLAVENTPEGLQRQQAFAQACEKAHQMGIDLRNVPEQYDARYVHRKIRFGMAIDDEIEAVERKAASEFVWVQTAKGRIAVRKDRLEEGMTQLDKPPAGYRYTAGGTRENIPGGPENPAQVKRLAQYKPDAQTALRRNVPFIVKTLGISPDKAMKLALQSRAMGPEATKRALYVAALRNLDDPDAAREASEMGMSYLFPNPNAPAPKPAAAAEPGFLDRAFKGVGDFIAGLGSARPTEAAPGAQGATPAANAAAGLPKPAPRVGAIEDGYEFLGGDPHEKANWQKVP